MKLLPEKCRYIKNNSGYSLVELLVVVSMLAVAVGIISLSVSVMFSRDAERVARTIDDQISEVRMAAMSKPGEYVLTIKTNSDGIGNQIEIKKTEVVLHDPTSPDPAPTPSEETKTIDIDKDAYIMFGESGSVPDDPASADYGDIVITFDKANGSINGITAFGNPADLTKSFEIKCIARKNTSKEKKIEIMPVTGRHYIE